MENSVDPDQTAPSGAVWSGSALFAYFILSDTLMLEILVHLGHHLLGHKATCFASLVGGQIFHQKITILTLSIVINSLSSVDSDQTQHQIQVYTVCFFVFVFVCIVFFYYYYLGFTAL